MTSPRRRWSYSLRTLFVVMTFATLACWLTSQLNWIHARHRFLQEEDPTLGMGAFSAPWEATPERPSPHSFPIVLRLLRETPMAFIRAWPAEDVPRVQRLFPEASVAPLYPPEWSDIGPTIPDAPDAPGYPPPPGFKADETQQPRGERADDESGAR